MFVIAGSISRTKCKKNTIFFWFSSKQDGRSPQFRQVVALRDVGPSAAEVQHYTFLNVLRMNCGQGSQKDLRLGNGSCVAKVI